MAIMEMKHLDTFLTVAEERSFTKAAKRLHCSQPPVSTRIKELEDELLVTLFERSTRIVTLTPAGEVFFEEVRNLFMSLQSAVENCRQAERGITGRLRISYTGVGSDFVLPRLIRAYRASHPDVSLEINGPSPNGEVELELLNDKTDVGICFLPLEDRNLGSRTIATLHLVVALPARHELTKLKSIPYKHLADEPFVAFPANKGFFLRRTLDAECIKAGFRARVVKESTASQTLLCLVAAGSGVAVLARENKWQGTEGVVFRPLRPNRTVQYGLAWNSTTRNVALSQFLEVATREFA
jgi:DNA-binding transcriptional LysR family regulator